MRITKNAKIMLSLVVSTFTVVAFQNCGDKVSVKKVTAQEDLSSQDPAVNPVLACIPRPKTQKITQAVNTGFQKNKVAMSLGANSFLSANEDLVAVFDNACLREKGARSIFSQRALAQGISSQEGLVAYRFTLGVDVLLSSMDRILQEDDCLHSVDKHAEYTLFLTPSPASTTATNDPRYSSLSHLSFIKHSQVYTQIFNSNNGINRDVRVGVLDSGVDLFHPDLSAMVLRNGSGEAVSFNAYNGTNTVTDAGFHGTHVAGLILASSNNAEGVSGVLGKNAKLMAIRVATDSSTNVLSPAISSAAVVNGIRWAADQGAEVLNVSLGGPTDSPTLREAVAYAANKGTLVVIAAGNDGKALNDSFKTYPAAYSKDVEGAITVGSVDSTSSAVSSFSNYSPTYVDIMSPGSDGTKGILSSVPTALGTSYASTISVKNPTTGVVSTSPIHGTSMATPVATGAAALMINLIKSRGLTPTPRQVEREFLIAARRNSSYSSYAANGQVLDLVSLVTRIDRDTGIDTSSTTARTALSGQVVLSKQPQSAERLVGESVSFETDLSEAGSLLARFQWYRNGIPIVGANREILELKDLSGADVGTYTVKATLGNTVATSSPATLKIGAAYCP